LKQVASHAIGRSLSAAKCHPFPRMFFNRNRQALSVGDVVGRSGQRKVQGHFRSSEEETPRNVRTRIPNFGCKRAWKEHPISVAKEWARIPYLDCKGAIRFHSFVCCLFDYSNRMLTGSGWLPGSFSQQRSPLGMLPTLAITPVDFRDHPCDCGDLFVCFDQDPFEQTAVTDYRDK
jgi:hypothetical protein